MASSNVNFDQAPCDLECPQVTTFSQEQPQPTIRWTKIVGVAAILNLVIVATVVAIVALVRPAAQQVSSSTGQADNKNPQPLPGPASFSPSLAWDSHRGAEAAAATQFEKDCWCILMQGKSQAEMEAIANITRSPVPPAAGTDPLVVAFHRTYHSASAETKAGIDNDIAAFLGLRTSRAPRQLGTGSTPAERPVLEQRNASETPAKHKQNTSNALAKRLAKDQRDTSVVAPERSLDLKNSCNDR